MMGLDIFIKSKKKSYMYATSGQELQNIQSKDKHVAHYATRSLIRNVKHFRFIFNC